MSSHPWTTAWDKRHSHKNSFFFTLGTRGFEQTQPNKEPTLNSPKNIIRINIFSFEMIWELTELRCKKSSEPKKAKQYMSLQKDCEVNRKSSFCTESRTFIKRGRKGIVKKFIVYWSQRSYYINSNFIRQYTIKTIPFI